MTDQSIQWIEPMSRLADAAIFYPTYGPYGMSDVWANDLLDRHRGRTCRGAGGGDRSVTYSVVDVISRGS